MINEEIIDKLNKTPEINPISVDDLKIALQKVKSIEPTFTQQLRKLADNLEYTRIKIYQSNIDFEDDKQYIDDRLFKIQSKLRDMANLVSDYEENVTIDDVIELLNDALEKDSEAIHNLATNRVSCNEELADHPTIQIGAKDNQYTVGIIGILNGIFGIAEDGYGAIAGDFEVICVNNHDVPDKARVGDKCAECGEKLQIGKLIRFMRIR
jgi:hypothetical protein